LGALRAGGQGGSDAGLRPRPRRHRFPGDRAGVPARLRGERGGRDHPAAQPAQPRGHHGVDRDHGPRDPAGVHRTGGEGAGGEGQTTRTGAGESRGPPEALGGTRIRRDLFLRRAADRPWRQVHRQRDPRGHGRDQRGPRAGRQEGQGAGELTADGRPAGTLAELCRYDGRRVVVTGCGSGIGALVVRQVSGLGAQVVGLDLCPPAADAGSRLEFGELDLADPDSIDRAVAAVGGPVDALFNVAGVSSGIGDPLRVATINFLGTRQLTEGLLPAMPAGSAIASVSSLAASGYLENRRTTAGLLATTTFAEGLDWCRRHPEALADGGYRLAKEALILYTMQRAGPLGANGIRINCTGPGVTDTPILDQLRSA